MLFRFCRDAVISANTTDSNESSVFRSCSGIAARILGAYLANQANCQGMHSSEFQGIILQALPKSFDLLISDPFRTPLALNLIEKIPSMIDQILHICWVSLTRRLDEEANMEDTFWLTKPLAHICWLISHSQRLLKQYSSFTDEFFQKI